LFLAGRHLAGKVTATSLSTGGKAVSKSQGAGNSTIETLAVAAENGTAIVDKECKDCNSTVITVSVGNETVTLDSTTPATAAAESSVTWELAAPCKGAPKKTGEDIDDFGRCWGWEDGQSCAFRNEDNTTMICSRKPVRERLPYLLGLRQSRNGAGCLSVVCTMLVAF
jgi:hypothetical protein